MIEVLNWLGENWVALLFLLPLFAAVLRYCYEILTGKV